MKNNNTSINDKSNIISNKKFFNSTNEQNVIFNDEQNNDSNIDYIPNEINYLDGEEENEEDNEEENEEDNEEENEEDSEEENEEENKENFIQYISNINTREKMVYIIITFISVFTFTWNIEYLKCILYIFIIMRLLN